MLKERIITSLAGILILLIALWLGVFWFTLLAGLAAIIAGWEFHNLVYKSKSGLIFSLGLALIFLLATGPAIKDTRIYLGVLSLITITFILVNVLNNSKKTVDLRSGWIFFCIILITGFFLSYYTYLIDLNQGRLWAILALFTTFAADSGAFFIGRTWGKTPLAPKISPNKTWEGAIGGLLCSIVAGLLLSYFFLGLSKSLYLSLVPGLLIGVLSPIGDLSVSFIKRRAGVKDSGSLLPGHGGLLDRIDSLLISGIVVYYYANLLGNLAT